MRNFLLLCGCWLAFSVAGAELQFSFSQLSSNSPLAKFHAELLGTGGPAAWSIVQDAVPSVFAPLTDRAENVARQSVLAQTSQDPADERFPMFIYDGEKFRDFKFKTRFEIVSGLTEQMAGVVFRFQNKSNFYVVRVSALGKNIRFYKVVNGARSNPIGPACNVTVGTWHQLAVTCEGTQITLWLDNQLVMPPLGDNSFSEGKVGFWTKSDSVSYFADATMSYTPIVPAAQALINNVLKQEPRTVGLRIYTLATNDTTRILASKDPTEVGQPGTEAELAAIRDGTISFGRDSGNVLLTMPLQDRNGENIAAVRFILKSFFGETEKNALMRATIIRRLMQDRCSSAEDLQK